MLLIALCGRSVSMISKKNSKKKKSWIYVIYNECVILIDVENCKSSWTTTMTLRSIGGETIVDTTLFE